MLKYILGVATGLVLAVGFNMVTATPKEVFGGLRKGIDKAEQIQVAECREKEASCYVQQGKTQKQCDELIRQKCGG